MEEDSQTKTVKIQLLESDIEIKEEKIRILELTLENSKVEISSLNTQIQHMKSHSVESEQSLHQSIREQLVLTDLKNQEKYEEYEQVIENLNAKLSSKIEAEREKGSKKQQKIVKLKAEVAELKKTIQSLGYIEASLKDCRAKLRSSNER